MKTTKQLTVTKLEKTEHVCKRLGTYAYVELILNNKFYFTFFVSPRPSLSYHIDGNVTVHRTIEGKIQGFQSRIGKHFYSWEAIGTHYKGLPQEVLEQVIQLAHQGGNSYCPLTEKERMLKK